MIWRFAVVVFLTQISANGGSRIYPSLCGMLRMALIVGCRRMPAAAGPMRFQR